MKWGIFIYSIYWAILVCWPSNHAHCAMEQVPLDCHHEHSHHSTKKESKQPLQQDQNCDWWCICTGLHVIALEQKLLLDTIEIKTVTHTVQSLSIQGWPPCIEQSPKGYIPKVWHPPQFLYKNQYLKN